MEGPLTGLDPEESPLSIVQDDHNGVRNGWQCIRNEQDWVCTMNLKRRGCSIIAETNILIGASPNNLAKVARLEKGRTHS